ncbi:MAG: hypothetical protein R3C28_11670 [Pirellulaceae bacterium]
MSLADYPQGCWIGRGAQLRSKKRGAIPDHLAPILERIGLDTSCWCELVQKFSKLFKRAAGKASESRGRSSSPLHWLHLRTGANMMLPEDA